MEMIVSLKQTSRIDKLIKYCSMLKIKSLIEQNLKDEAIKLSIKDQVLCKLTAFICRIKENPDMKGK